MSKHRYIITWAQNKTPVHASFFKSLQHFPGQLKVILGRYKNPTSIWNNDEEEWWAPEIMPFVMDSRQPLCKKLVVYGDIHILPTAKRPLTGWEVFCGHASGVFGHPKHAMETVPTSTRDPRFLLTTGACTLPNYTDSKAGKHGEAHHIIGALVIEVDSDGAFFSRQVNADKNGNFIDLDKLYTPTGVEQAPPALALALGDFHAGTEDPKIIKATKSLVSLVKPENLILHDLLDTRSVSHHDAGSIRKKVDKSLKNKSCLKTEVSHVANVLRIMSSWATHVRVVRSNHDEAFEKFLETANPHTIDSINIPYYYAVWNRLLEHREAHGEFPDALAMEVKRLGVPANVHFLKRNDDLVLGGVGYNFHGDKGSNGAKSSNMTYAKLGVKTVTGHAHSPGIWDGNFRVGITGSLYQGYNDLPSAWAPAHVLHYGNNKRTVITINGSRFRINL